MDISEKILGNTFATDFRPDVVLNDNLLSDIDKKSNENIPKTDTYPIIKDTYKISDEAKQLQKKSNTSIDNTSESTQNKKNENPDELTEAEQQVVDDLKQRDSEVRTHEQAHLSAGAGLVKGGASYSYQIGPDGKRYAIGGEVQIDISAVPNDPQATITKMQRVKAAAMAPADPSGQDRAVAAMASQIESQARSESSSQKTEKAISAYKKPNASSESSFSKIA